MPEIITIIFDCYAPSDGNSPDPITDLENCEDANEALADFLKEHHISYYVQDVTRKKLRNIEDKLHKKGVTEVG
jgi:hypothetical protein